MSASKRRAEAPAERPRPDKKHKPEKRTAEKAAVADRTRPAQTISILQEEEKAFPRGGANVLTPLEQRQIQTKAKQDVLFEHATGKKALASFDSDSDEEALSDAQPDTKSKVSRKSKKDSKAKHKEKKKGDSGDSADAGPKIEGLGYKRLIAGSIVLGQVARISRYDVTITLPNSLLGYLPITAVSPELTDKVEKLAAAEDSEDDSEDDETDDKGEILLSDYFQIGQYIRVCVTQIGSAGGNLKERNKKHISLSAMPAQVNGELSKGDLIPNNVVQASVQSVEDHGAVVSVGLGEQEAKGFISSRELPAHIKLSNLKVGAVMLCMVLGMNSSGKTVKLTASGDKLSVSKKNGYLTDAPSVDTFLPGCAVDILVTNVTEAGLAGKVMGLLEVTADWIHSTRDLEQKPLEKRHPVGSQVRGRVICTFPASEEKKLGVSLLPHLLDLSSQKPKQSDKLPADALPIGSIVEEAKVINVEGTTGLLLDLGVKGVPGFAHISRLSDDRVDSISSESGPYKLGSTHRARVVGYNALDGLYVVSLEQRTLEAAFLQMEDVPIGSNIKATVQKVYLNAGGDHTVVVDLGNGISGRATGVHLSDVRLKDPETKFREGVKVSGRVLNVNSETKHIALTFKKSLVNSDAPVWKTYADPQIGQQSPGTISKITPKGAVVRYYGEVTAFLPSSQMSESFVQDPLKHFKVGQVVTTHPISIEPADRKMRVSCRDLSSSGPEQQMALEQLQPGTLVSGTVSEKAEEQLVIELSNSRLKAILTVEHLSDGSANKCASAAKKIRVGQKLENLLVLQKNASSQTVQISSKPALIKAAQIGKSVSKLEQLEVGGDVVGYVASITEKAVYVRFLDGLTGLLPRDMISEQAVQLPDFGLRREATVFAKVASVDTQHDRFLLTQKEVSNDEERTSKSVGSNQTTVLVNPVDGHMASSTDFKVGTITKAKIKSVKETQLNVTLADGVEGRVDVSEAFDTWHAIKDHKSPLRTFSPGTTLDVRILGMHDHRNHRFLPISNTGKTLVYELTTKASPLEASNLDILTMDQLQEGKEYLCFVNNVAHDSLWVNITPNIRGRISAMDASDNASLLTNLEKHFPIGSALRARVISVDTQRGQLDLSARLGPSKAPKEFADLTEGAVLPAKVTRVTERQIMVKLSENVSGPVNLVELADDFAEADPSKFEKGQIIRVHISKVDAPNKRLTISARPSKVLSSTLPIVDRDYTSFSQLAVNDIVRGFIKNVADNGIFVALSSNVSVFVPVRELSDRFIKDWKAEFEVDQLVKGRLITVDAASDKAQMSLKTSVLDKGYKAPLGWHDLKVGQIVTGKVRKVADYGVFILVDASANVSGLCHKSEMADEMVKDVSKLYSQGDRVKAKVLKINPGKQGREVAFGLKASYFQEIDQMELDEESDSEASDDAGANSINGSDTTGGIRLDDDDEGGVMVAFDDISEQSDSDSAFGDKETLNNAVVNSATHRSTKHSESLGLDVGGFGFSGGLNTGGFNHSGKHTMADLIGNDSDSESESETHKKKQRRKAQIQVDHTAELDVNGPQSTADFERLLMTDPNSSLLWVSYMAHYLQLNEVTKAREVAERAIKIVNNESRDTQEDVLNVWMGYLNLENTYGNDETCEAVFNRARQYNDAKEIYTRLASTYIQSGKTEHADALFQVMVKKFSQDPAVWYNYATFLFDTAKQPVQGRELLKRALQALAEVHAFNTTVKFAQLEFKSANGDTERGRTMLEGLISTFPKRLDLFNVYLDLEIKIGDVDTIRRLFQRVTNSKKLTNPRKARPFFKRWEEWEEQNGDAKGIEKARARAEDWVRKHMEDKEKEKE